MKIQPDKESMQETYKTEIRPILQSNIIKMNNEPFESGMTEKNTTNSIGYKTVQPGLVLLGGGPSQSTYHEEREKTEYKKNYSKGIGNDHHHTNEAFSRPIKRSSPNILKKNIKNDYNSPYSINAIPTSPNPHLYHVNSDNDSTFESNNNYKYFRTNIQGDIEPRYSIESNKDSSNDLNSSMLEDRHDDNIHKTNTNNHYSLVQAPNDTTSGMDPSFPSSNTSTNKTHKVLTEFNGMGEPKKSITPNQLNSSSKQKSYNELQSIHFNKLNKVKSTLSSTVINDFSHNKINNDSSLNESLLNRKNTTTEYPRIMYSNDNKSSSFNRRSFAEMTKNSSESMYYNEQRSDANPANPATHSKNFKYSPPSSATLEDRDQYSSYSKNQSTNQTKNHPVLSSDEIKSPYNTCETGTSVKNFRMPNVSSYTARPNENLDYTQKNKIKYCREMPEKIMISRERRRKTNEDAEYAFSNSNNDTDIQNSVYRDEECITIANKKFKAATPPIGRKMPLLPPALAAETEYNYNHLTCSYDYSNPNRSDGLNSARTFSNKDVQIGKKPSMLPQRQKHDYINYTNSCETAQKNSINLEHGTRPSRFKNRSNHHSEYDQYPTAHERRKGKNMATNDTTHDNSYNSASTIDDNDKYSPKSYSNCSQTESTMSNTPLRKLKVPFEKMVLSDGKNDNTESFDRMHATVDYHDSPSSKANLHIDYTREAAINSNDGRNVGQYNNFENSHDDFESNNYNYIHNDFRQQKSDLSRGINMSTNPHAAKDNIHFDDSDAHYGPNLRHKQRDSRPPNSKNSPYYPLAYEKYSSFGIKHNVNESYPSIDSFDEKTAIEKMDYSPTVAADNVNHFGIENRSNSSGGNTRYRSRYNTNRLDNNIINDKIGSDNQADNYNGGRLYYDNFPKPDKDGYSSHAKSIPSETEYAHYSDIKSQFETAQSVKSTVYDVVEKNLSSKYHIHLPSKIPFMIKFDLIIPEHLKIAKSYSILDRNCQQFQALMSFGLPESVLSDIAYCIFLRDPFVIVNKFKLFELIKITLMTSGYGTNQNIYNNNEQPMPIYNNPNHKPPFIYNNNSKNNLNNSNSHSNREHFENNAKSMVQDDINITNNNIVIDPNVYMNGPNQPSDKLHHLAGQQQLQPPASMYYYNNMQSGSNMNNCMMGHEKITRSNTPNNTLKTIDDCFFAKDLTEEDKIFSITNIDGQNSSITGKAFSMSNRSLIAKYSYNDYDIIYHYKQYNRWPENTEPSRKAYLRRKSRKFSLRNNHLYNISAGDGRIRIWLRDAEAVEKYVERFHLQNDTHLSRNQTISKMLQHCYSSDIVAGITNYIAKCSYCIEHCPDGYDSIPMNSGTLTSHFDSADQHDYTERHSTATDHEHSFIDSCKEDEDMTSCIVEKTTIDDNDVTFGNNVIEENDTSVNLYSNDEESIVNIENDVTTNPTETKNENDIHDAKDLFHYECDKNSLLEMESSSGGSGHLTLETENNNAGSNYRLADSAAKSMDTYKLTNTSANSSDPCNNPETAKHIDECSLTADIDSCTKSVTSMTSTDECNMQATCELSDLAHKTI